MTIAYITAGAAGTICGNCLQDNALAAALKSEGHDVVLLPAYTPLLTDETDVSDRRVVFGGINLYLQGKIPFFRRAGILDWLIDSPRLLRWASGFAVETDPANLGQMTRDMFRGEAGPYRREMRKLVALLREIRPHLVHLTNSMLASIAHPVKRDLGIPVVCSLQGEADFLAGLPQPYREHCYSALERHASHFDGIVAPCEDQAEAMAPALGKSANRVKIIRSGISVEGFQSRSRRDDGRFVVGFLARISSVKGLELLAEAVDLLRSRVSGRSIELRVAGWRAGATHEYVDRLRERHGFDDAGYLPRERKIEFLAGLDAFCVPTTYRASKGLYVLEALAAGVPVVQPRIGVFPELVRATGGGLLFEPGDSRDLADKLEAVMEDSRAADRIGAAGRKAVLESFHSGRMATETLALYGSIAGNAVPRRSMSDR